jgi:glutathione synthase/RimK-type ligase-like ATP-grasp enzyme
MLGSRYIAKIDDNEAGSALEDINRKNHPDLMMQQFLQEAQQQQSEEKDRTRIN